MEPWWCKVSFVGVLDRCEMFWSVLYWKWAIPTLLSVLFLFAAGSYFRFAMFQHLAVLRCRLKLLAKVKRGVIYHLLVLNVVVFVCCFIIASVCAFRYKSIRSSRAALPWLKRLESHDAQCDQRMEHIFWEKVWQGMLLPRMVQSSYQ